MGRGKKRERTKAIPLTDSETTGRLAPPVTVAPRKPVPAYAAEALTGLRKAIDERLERELEGLREDESLADYMGLEHPEGPLRWFLDYIVYDECDTQGVDLSLTVSDADEDSLDGIAIIVTDYKKAQSEPVPAMSVYVDWSSYQGPEGAIDLADEFYSAFDKLLAARDL
jgi:hypothetical protein